MLTAQPSQGCTRDEVTSIRRPDSVKRGGHHANIHSDEYADARGTPDPAQRSRPPRTGEQGDNRLRLQGGRAVGSAISSPPSRLPITRPSPTCRSTWARGE